jgi:hypothetical protein
LPNRWTIAAVCWLTVKNGPIIRKINTNIAIKNAAVMSQLTVMLLGEGRGLFSGLRLEP